MDRWMQQLSDLSSLLNIVFLWYPHVRWSI